MMIDTLDNTYARMFVVHCTRCSFRMEFGDTYTQTQSTERAKHNLKIRNSLYISFVRLKLLFWTEIRCVFDFFLRFPIAFHTVSYRVPFEQHTLLSIIEINTLLTFPSRFVGSHLDANVYFYFLQYSILRTESEYVGCDSAHYYENNFIEKML